MFKIKNKILKWITTVIGAGIGLAASQYFGYTLLIYIIVLLSLYWFSSSPIICKLTKNKFAEFSEIYILCSSQGIIIILGIIIMLIYKIKIDANILLLFSDPIILFTCLIWLYFKTNIKPLIALLIYETLTVIYKIHQIFNNEINPTIIMVLVVAILTMFILFYYITGIYKKNKILKTEQLCEIKKIRKYKIKVKKYNIALYLIVTLLIISQCFLFYQNYNYHKEIINLTSIEKSDNDNMKSNNDNNTGILNELLSDAKKNNGNINSLNDSMKEIYNSLNLPYWNSVVIP